MKKLYILLALFIGVPTVSSAKQAMTDSIRSFIKTHEGKIAVIAAAVAGTGMGSYITYYFARRRIRAIQTTIDKEISNLGQQNREYYGQKCIMTHRFRDVVQATIEDYLKNKSDLVTKCNVSIGDRVFKVDIEGEENFFGPNFSNSIAQWPLWRYKGMEKPDSIAVSSKDGKLVYSFKFE